MSDQFIFYFNGTISREQHKSHLVRLKDLWDGFVHFPAFFSPRKVNVKIPINAGLPQTGIARTLKMALEFWFHRNLF